MSDILFEIASDKYSDVLDTLQKDWPNSIHVYYSIKLSVIWQSKDALEIKIYCPENNPKCGVVVAVVKFKMIDWSSVHLYSVDESGLEKLKRILRETKILDWSKRVSFQATHEKVVPLLSEFAAERNLDYKNFGYRQVWMPREKAKNITVGDLPSDSLTLKNLEASNIDICNRTWAYMEPGTDKFIGAMINRSGGVGLFQKDSDDPISWNVITHFYALGILYTLEKHRQKGYASIVTKALSKKLADDGVDPYACILINNKPSLAMYKTLGFEEICLVYWGYCVPKSMNL